MSLGGSLLPLLPDDILRHILHILYEPFPVHSKGLLSRHSVSDTSKLRRTLRLKMDQISKQMTRMNRETVTSLRFRVSYEDITSPVVVPHANVKHVRVAVFPPNDLPGAVAIVDWLTNFFINDVNPQVCDSISIKIYLNEPNDEILARIVTSLPTTTLKRLKLTLAFTPGSNDWMSHLSCYTALEHFDFKHKNCTQEGALNHLVTMGSSLNILAQSWTNLKSLTIPTYAVWSEHRSSAPNLKGFGALEKVVLREFERSSPDCFSRLVLEGAEDKDTGFSIMQYYLSLMFGPPAVGMRLCFEKDSVTSPLDYSFLYFSYSTIGFQIRLSFLVAKGLTPSFDTVVAAISDMYYKSHVEFVDLVLKQCKVSELSRRDKHGNGIYDYILNCDRIPVSHKLSMVKYLLDCGVNPHGHHCDGLVAIDGLFLAKGGAELLDHSTVKANKRPQGALSLLVSSVWVASMFLMDEELDVLQPTVLHKLLEEATLDQLNYVRRDKSLLVLLGSMPGIVEFLSLRPDIFRKFSFNVNQPRGVSHILQRIWGNQKLLDLVVCFPIDLSTRLTTLDEQTLELIDAGTLLSVIPPHHTVLFRRHFKLSDITSAAIKRFFDNGAITAVIEDPILAPMLREPLSRTLPHMPAKTILYSSHVIRIIAKKQLIDKDIIYSMAKTDVIINHPTKSWVLVAFMLVKKAKKLELTGEQIDYFRAVATYCSSIFREDEIFNYVDSGIELEQMNFFPLFVGCCDLSKLTKPLCVYYGGKRCFKHLGVAFRHGYPIDKLPVIKIQSLMIGTIYALREASIDVSFEIAEKLMDKAKLDALPPLLSHLGHHPKGPAGDTFAHYLAKRKATQKLRNLVDVLPDIGFDPRSRNEAGQTVGDIVRSASKNGESLDPEIGKYFT